VLLPEKLVPHPDDGSPLVLYLWKHSAGALRITDVNGNQT
jgi:hypothetical protein